MVGRQHIIWHNFCRKLHEIEKKRNESGTLVPRAPRSATDHWCNKSDGNSSSR